ncbi:transposase [Oscillospiraceae bacterium 50-16]
MWDDESPQDHKPKEECLMADIIAGRKAISKFFYLYGFGEKLSSVAQKRLTEIICGLAMKGNQSRTTDFAELKQGFRTSYGHFLSKGKWDEQKVSQQQQTEALRQADELALAKGAPIYLSIDDTVIEKKKPSSRATRPMEGTGWHYSHLEGKQVFGFRWVNPKFCVNSIWGANRAKFI